MATILTCLDGSAYVASVCDHAAWLAGGAGGTIDLLHCAESQTASAEGAAMLKDAAARIADQGGLVRRARLESEAFHEAARREATHGGAMVIGKRGLSGQARHRGLGSNAAALLREATEPLLLVSSLYLPIHRGLVLIDADPNHRRTVEFVAAHPLLSALELDIVMMQPIGMDPEPKLTWARAKLGDGDADVFPMHHGSPDEAAARYMADHRVDVIVMSRQMLFTQALGLGLAWETRAVWSWRTPLFIC